MADDSQPPRDPQHSGPGRPEMISFQVRGPVGATVAVAVDHRKSPDDPWVCARSISLIAPAEATVRVCALKEDVRLRSAVVGGVGAEEADVLILPPEWLPC